MHERMVMLYKKAANTIRYSESFPYIFIHVDHKPSFFNMMSVCHKEGGQAVNYTVHVCIICGCYLVLTVLRQCRFGSIRLK